MPNNLGGSSGSGGSGSGSGSGSGAGGSSKGSSGNTNPSGSSTGPGGSSNVSASLGPNGQVVITTTNNQTGQVSYATQPVGGGSVVNYGSTNPSSPGAVAITQTQANLAQQVGGGKSVSGAISPTASLFSVNGALNPLGFTTTSKTSASSASP
ncbi:MAG: hypothetical protein KGH62_01885, partial [Candidatus Micrarchaeota archaeon]|nr:hypothetical protein [Candidatus Micrarchaeota archaeon]